jgi:adenylosuccinate synthase
VGWLDLVLLRYSIRINRINELALTKLDILSGFNQLQLCTGYHRGENLFSELPYGPGKLHAFEPVYEELPGWSEDITGIRDWADLPENAKTYIQKIEELVRVKVRLISVGPERDQVIENF